MRKAIVTVQFERAGVLIQLAKDRYKIVYDEGYSGPPISLALPTTRREYEFDVFPPFFDGLLPEGIQLQGLLKIRKLDAKDYFGQLLAVGSETVGDVCVYEAEG